MSHRFASLLMFQSYNIINFIIAGIHLCILMCLLCQIVEDDTEEHFAGFLTKVSGHNSHNEHPKSKKEAMVEVVANSKIQKVCI